MMQTGQKREINLLSIDYIRSGGEFWGPYVNEKVK